jgi:hypothetical protein
VDVLIDGHAKFGWKVSCPNCGLDGPTHRLRTDALEAWNRRPALTEAAPELLEALRPFAASCDEADKSARDLERFGGGVLPDRASPGWGVTYRALKAARAAVSKAEGKQ